MFLGHGAFPEPVLEFSCHVLHVTHASSAFRASALGFKTPIILTHFGSGVSAGGTCFLLNVKGRLATPTANGVGFGVSLTKGSCTFSLLNEQY